MQPLERSESLMARLERFFYDEEVPYGLALCRIYLPLVLMGLVLPRWVVCRELYSADGATSQLSVGFCGTEMLPELPGGVVAGLYAILVFSLVTLCVGWCTRISALIACVLLSYFCMLDCISTMTKYTVICSHVFLILSLSQCGSIWSVDTWLATKQRTDNPTQPRIVYPKSAAWPRRLMQLLISLVYFGAGMTKIHTPSFFSGDQLQYWMLTHLNYQHPIGEFFSLYPILLVAVSYVTVVWEIVFVFCVWKGYLRNVILPVGILFHFMTGLTLGLIMFPMVCYATYLAFVDEDDVQRSYVWLRRQSRRFHVLKQLRQLVVRGETSLQHRPEWRRPAQILFAVALPVIAFLGVELEYSWDVYGERRPEGRHQLVAVEPERAKMLLAPATPQRDIDKFFAVDMGTFLISGILADRRTSFRQGETMIAQCNLVPPHSDMVVECKIRDMDNRLIERIYAIGLRENLRVDIKFAIPETLPPGEYSMAVETAGRHVMQKTFKILPKYGTVASR